MERKKPKNLFKIRHLIRNQIEHEQKIFGFSSSQKSKERCFLALVEPVANCIYKKLVAFKTSNFNLNQIVTNQTVMNIISDYFGEYLTPILARICVLEMHSASKRNLLDGNNSQEHFNFFVNCLYDKNIAISILNKYPEIESHLEILLTQFFKNIKKIWLRIATDWSDLRSILKTNDILQLYSILPVGDFHSSNQYTALLIFKNEKNKKFKLIYKPRSLQVDIAFSSYINWYNQHSDIDLRGQPKILDKIEYGWCEFIEHKSCQNERELQNFYLRLGALAGLLYSISTLDIHASNVISYGEYPIIIDCECIASVNPYSIEKKIPNFLATLILPFYLQEEPNFPRYDLSSFSGGRNSYYPSKSYYWKNSGKDTMQLSRRFKKSKFQCNQPKLNNMHINPFDFKKNFLKGFIDSVSILIKHKTELLSKETPINFFNHIQTRIILNKTSDYFQIINDSYHPLLLNNSKKRQEFFSSFYRNNNSKHEEIIYHEINDLLHSDIPYFYAYTDSNNIYSSNVKKLNCKLPYSGFSYILFCIKNYLNFKNLNFLIQLINNSFLAAELNFEKNYKNYDKNHTLKNFKISKNSFREKSLLISKKILDNLLDLSIEDNTNFYWPTTTLKNSGCWNADLTNYSLYQGTPGIILVYALSEKFLNTNYFLLDKYLEKIEFQITRNQILNDVNFIGVFDGLGGILYLLCHIYKIKNNEKIVPLVEKILKILSLKINNDIHLDIITGVSGLLRILIHVANCFSTVSVINLINDCITHLMNIYPHPKNVKKDKNLLFGFSHGITGITWSLCHWTKFYNDKKFEDWISQAWSIIDNDFLKRPHKYQYEDNYFTWCNGLVGICLSQLDLLDFFDKLNFEKSIHSHTHQILSKGFSSKTLNLCHGQAGNLDFLIETAMTFKTNSKYQTAYQEHASYLVNMVDYYYKSTPLEKFLANPGLMVGVSGLVYQLLRIAFPEDVPSLLLLKI